MNPPLFTILNASAPVKALLGTSPLRVFPWGEAPPAVTKPYAVYAVFNGLPENTMDQTPLLDNLGTQINVYGVSVASCQSAAEAIRDALEPEAHMVNFSNPVPDTETKLFLARMDFDFFTER